MFIGAVVVVAATVHDVSVGVCSAVGGCVGYVVLLVVVLVLVVLVLSGVGVGGSGSDGGGCPGFFYH